MQAVEGGREFQDLPNTCGLIWLHLSFPALARGANRSDEKIRPTSLITESDLNRVPHSGNDEWAESSRRWKVE